MQIFLLLVLPIATAAVMLATREHLSLRHYFWVCLLIVGIATISWMSVENISWARGLSGGGFRTWALPLAAVTISILCSWRSGRKYIQVVQIVAAVILANLCFAYAGWVA